MTTVGPQGALIPIVLHLGLVLALPFPPSGVRLVLCAQCQWALRDLSTGCDASESLGFSRPCAVHPSMGLLFTSGFPFSCHPAGQG